MKRREFLCLLTACILLLAPMRAGATHLPDLLPAGTINVFDATGNDEENAESADAQTKDTGVSDNGIADSKESDKKDDANSDNTGDSRRLHWFRRNLGINQDRT